MSQGLHATVVLIDKAGQTAKSMLAYDPSWLGLWADKSDNLQTILKKYTQAKVLSRSDNYFHAFARPKKADFGDIDEMGTTDQKAVIILRETETGKNRKLEIPAPKKSMFELVDDQGWRVTAAAGEDIADTLNASGYKVTFAYGWFKSKK